jgi:hypothetical protein
MMSYDEERAIVALTRAWLHLAPEENQTFIRLNVAKMRDKRIDKTYIIRYIVKGINDGMDKDIWPEKLI